MDKTRLLMKSSGRKPLLVLLMSLLFLTTSALSDVTSSQPSETDKGKVVRQVAQKWIQVGAEQYKRGYFKAANQSFVRAQDYQDYLTADERGKLTALIDKTQQGIAARERILETIRAADELVKQGETDKAQARLEEIKGSEFLTDAERDLIAKGIDKLSSKLDEQKKESTELYNRSVESYKAGDLEKAREGFIKVIAANDVVAAPQGEAAENYLMKIDSTLATKASPSESTAAQPEDELGATIEAITKEIVNGKKAEPNEPKAVPEQQVTQVTKEPNAPVVAAVPEEQAPEAAPNEAYIDIVNRKRDIRLSHTKAVISDAVAKVQDDISKDEFDKAKGEVEKAERVVNEYQQDLGDELYNQNIGELKQLSDKINQAQADRAQQLQEQKRSEAIEAQRHDREQMEADRNKRVAELMENAVTFQTQQRYDEALGQLNSLLALDPQNNQALILKQTLEDMVSFRRQLEAQRESEKERVSTLIGADEALIPYAEELKHPKDWREIVAKRKPDLPIGQNAAEAAVDKQLDEIVDLSQLTPETPFGEAVEMLKNSVTPPLKIFVNWRDLYDNADIDQTTPIHMDPISAIPLKEALGLLLKAVSGGFSNVSYGVKNGVITIATTGLLPNEMTTQVYDVTDLIGRPADFYAQTGGSITAATQGEAGTEQLGEQEQTNREQLIADAAQRAEALRQLIQQTVKPESWFESGGEGSITVYERKKFAIYQTAEVHREIEKLLDKLREKLGHQVAIEARFLTVGENFLEDIGLDINFNIQLGNKPGGWGRWSFKQNSSLITQPIDTGVSGSLVTTTAATPAITGTGGWGNVPLLLTDLDVAVILRATQAHRDAKALTAPKVTVLSGEMAAFRVQKYERYPANVTVDITQVGQQITSSTTGTATNPAFMWTVGYEERSIVSGTLLNITPIITPDKKNVLLNIVTEWREFLDFRPFTLQLPVVGANLGTDYTISLPETEISRVETRVSVPDKATLLLGGQRITVETETEAGVPVLSKVPFFGRLFSNRSKVKDSQILLILVKPTIILREEKEAEAIAAMESGS